MSTANPIAQIPVVGKTLVAALPFIMALIIFNKYGGAVAAMLPNIPSGTGPGTKS